ncbi:ATP-binding protein [candidate division KSB1 bacterium]
MPRRSKDENNGNDQRDTHLERSLNYITEEYVLRMRELSLIKRIAEALVDATDKKKVCLDLTGIILDEIEAEHCLLFLFNEKQETLKLTAQQYQEDRNAIYYTGDSASLTCAVGEGIPGTVIETKNPLYIKNLKSNKKFKNDPCIPDKNLCAYCLPLIAGDENIGVIVLTAPEKDAFSKEDQRILQIIANQTAIVLSNVMLVKRLQISNNEQQKTLQRLIKAEREISRYAQDLEKMVDQRTSELIQSEKMAVIGQLVASVAHELNNPLSIITGYVDILTSLVEIPPKFKQKLYKVQKAANRSSKIVNNLLRLSRKGKIERDNIDVTEIIEETLELYEYQFRLNNINVIKRLMNDLPKTIGDHQQLQQVILNLLSNAQDALKEIQDNRFITITTRSDDEHIYCDIKDTGPGINIKEQKKIFEPFFTLKEVGKGTGLGLSLSREIMLEHGGDVDIDPTYKKGANFIVTIPIIRDIVTEKKEKTYTDDVIGSSTRILLIDEEQDIISFQKDILEKYTNEIHEAFYAQDALELIQNNDYDVIVMELDIPGEFKGKNFYETIIELKPSLQRKIVFTTGNIGVKSIRELYESSEYLIIEKPFPIKDFIDAICRCLISQ